MTLINKDGGRATVGGEVAQPKAVKRKGAYYEPHWAWGATLRPKALFNCSRLCTSTSYNGQANVWFVRVCCSHEAIIDRGIHAPLHWIYILCTSIHTEWTNYTATYITVHNHKNIFEGVPSVITYTTHKVLSQPSGSHVFQAYMSSLSPTMVSPTSIVGEIKEVAQRETIIGCVRVYLVVCLLQRYA